MFGISESLFQFLLINVILALSIFITLYAGIFSMANVGFMALGAYTGVICTQNFGLPLWIGLIAGMLASGVCAYLLGLPILRLHDIYLAIATIGFGEIVRIFLLNFDNFLSFIYGTEVVLTGGALGIKGIPKISETWYLLAFIAFILLIFHLLGRSRFGRVLIAIREDELIAGGMGIDIVKIKSAVFVLSGVLAGAAGVFSAHLTRIISPGIYNFSRAVDVLAYTVLGGTVTWVGPVVGASILTALPEFARPLKEYNQIFNGLILLFVIVYLPNGIIGPKFLHRTLGKVKKIFLK
ncbi:MAG: branched-chain amino acid ABC transporter permease [Chloroflexi bacterium]|nr:branched-chain amino acid ABC transporter permease [Chloroflexota bacterium]